MGCIFLYSSSVKSESLILVRETQKIKVIPHIRTPGAGELACFKMNKNTANEPGVWIGDWFEHWFYTVLN